VEPNAHRLVHDRMLATARIKYQLCGFIGNSLIVPLPNKRDVINAKRASLFALDAIALAIPVSINVSDETCFEGVRRCWTQDVEEQLERQRWMNAEGIE
jgi:hypothetical protein